MGILALCICLFIYIFLGNALLKKKGSLFVPAYIVYIWIYDWMFINISYTFPKTILDMLKLGHEALVVLAFLLFLNSKYRYTNQTKKVVNRAAWFILCPALYFIIISIINKAEISISLQGVRLFFGAIIYPYIFYISGLLTNVSLTRIKQVLVFMLITSLAYSLYQDFTFSGDLSSLWFYDYFQGMVDFESGDFNFIRNDKLRVTSFFVSPIIATLFFSTTALLLFLLEKKKFYQGLFFFLALYGAYLTRTRIGLIYVVLFIILFLIYRKWSINYTILATLFAVIITLVSLQFGISDDLSALGRLVQYQDFFIMFTPFGNGVSEEYIIKFDSYIISIFFFIGYCGFLVIWSIIYLIKLTDKIFLVTEDPRFKYFIVFIIINSLCMIYEFFFQYMAGNYTYKLTFFLLFIALSSLQNKEKNI